ncbi:MAG TPA: YidC/Oxa1 family membrane protein insertase [Candidatus Methylomirabilis sp.]|nr:YidC/Oxa1 family membrane protein insertase [Candidatus Methylomirabilis sp.]
MSNLFNEYLTRPILNLLLWLYDVVPGQDLGIAIILLTVIVKGVLYPFAVAQIKQQRALQTLQPKIDEIRKRLATDKEAQAKELMELYKAEKVNPAASCLPLLIQLPIFIALYHALASGLKSEGFSMLYPFVPNPGQVNPMLFGFVNLAKPNYVLAVIAGLIQFWQTRQILIPPGAVTPPPGEVAGKEGAKDESMATMMNKQMMYVMPVVTVVIGFSLPGGLTLYWLTMSALTVLQQWYMLKKHPVSLTTNALTPPPTAPANPA